MSAPSILAEAKNLQILVNGLREGALGHGANDSVHLLPILEDHHRGDAADAVLGGDARALIGVQLDLMSQTACAQGITSVLPSRAPMSQSACTKHARDTECC